MGILGIQNWGGRGVGSWVFKIGRGIGDPVYSELVEGGGILGIQNWREGGDLGYSELEG